MLVKEPIISVSGLRGVIGESLSPELAMRFACAFSAGLPEGPLVLTRDGRPSGPMLAEAIRAGLIAVGRSVLDGDVAATPTTGVLIRQHAAVGGIQISASHNPPPYNGLKLFNAQGQVLSAESGERVVQQYHQGEIAWVDHLRLGETTPCAETLEHHAGLVLATVATQRIRDRQFRVLLDSNGGAGSLLGRHLLTKLGCQITVLGGENMGQFEHPPEPTAENLAGVQQRVVEAGADVGFCQDPDADRLAVIDENGRYIGEEFTLALCLDHILRQQKGPVVTNCSTSRMAQDLAEKYGVPFQRSAVGEANVVALMRETSAVFGGEGNGGPIDPRVGYVRDSFVGMAQVLDAMAARQSTLSHLADELPQYAICKTKVPLKKDRISAALAALEDAFAEATPDHLDGLRLDWADRWLLVRASNTEPIVRAVAEAPIPSEAQELCDRASAIINSV
jgi:phosphomannomutase